MKKKFIILAVVLAIVSTASAQVGALRIPQQTGSRSGQRTERLITPAANQILGFDANKKLVAKDRTSADAAIGYATGAGGAVTQLTSRTTTVVLAKLTGKITTTADSMAAQAPTTFTVTDTTVAAADGIVLTKISGDVDTFAWVNSVAAGSFTVTLFNTNASVADTTAFVFRFHVLKGSDS